MKPRATIAIVALVAACKHDEPKEVAPVSSASPVEAPALVDGQPIAPLEEPVAERPLAPLRERTELPSPFAEARRADAGDFPYAGLLEGASELIAEHFHGERDLAVQDAQLEDARHAMIVSAKSGEPRPLVIVTDDHGTVLWTKPRPFAGIRPGVERFTITAGPSGTVAVCWFDQASATLALRTWQPDGAILADFQLLEAETADSLAALHWPGVGYLAAIGDHGAIRVQLLGDGGELRFGREGKSVGARGDRATPPALVIDTEKTALVFFYAHGSRGDEVRGARFRDDGAPLWPEPVVVDGVKLGDGPAPRLDAQRADLRRVTVTLPGGRKVDVTSDGQVITKRR